MAPLADFLLAHVPVSLPHYLTSYIPGQTPLSTTPAVLAALTSYLAIIFGVKALMKNQQPHKLNLLFQTHNVILSSGSLLLLVLMLEEILPIWWNRGIDHALCSEQSWTPVRLLCSGLVVSSLFLQRMEFYYMINYYFKYLELLDTVFLAFKKKPLRESHLVLIQDLSHSRRRIPSRLPSLCNCFALLFPTEWQDQYCECQLFCLACVTDV